MADLVPAADGLPLAPASPLQRVRTLTAQPTVKRALPWFLGAAAIGGALLTYAALAPTSQRMLYSQLDDAQRAEVAASLDKAGIAYAINPDTGAVYTARQAASFANAALAAAIPHASLLPASMSAAVIAALPLASSCTVISRHAATGARPTVLPHGARCARASGASGSAHPRGAVGMGYSCRPC